MTELTCELATTLRQIRHQPKKKCYAITLEVPEDIGARIMEYASMLGGLRPWEVSKLLDGGLRLKERGAGVNPCPFCQSEQCDFCNNCLQCNPGGVCGECDPVSTMADHGCLGCGDDSRVCGCAE